MTSPENAAPASEPTVDADGHRPATLPLRCPYCTRGEIEPILEYTGFAYSEHRDWTGTQCYSCSAEWERDGTPRKGPHQASLDYEERVRQAAAEAVEA